MLVFVKYFRGLYARVKYTYGSRGEASPKLRSALLYSINSALRPQKSRKRQIDLNKKHMLPSAINFMQRAAIWGIKKEQALTISAKSGAHQLNREAGSPENPHV